jgi:hypothetical protein
MKTTKSLLAQWREANRLASEAEGALFDATLKYASGQGPRPTEEMMEEARVLRTQAKALFERAVQRVQSSSSFGPLSD